MVASVPKLLTGLSVIGTIAMLWVGGGILVHGTHDIGFHGLYDLVHGAEMAVAGASGDAWRGGRMGDLCGFVGLGGVDRGQRDFHRPA